MGTNGREGVDVITFQVSRTWNPKRMGVSGDDRDLGVALATNDPSEIGSPRLHGAPRGGIFDRHELTRIKTDV